MCPPPDATSPDDEAALFREAMAGVAPMRPVAPVSMPARKPAAAHVRRADEAAALQESRPSPIDPDLETGEELRYLRAGAAAQLLQRLRRGRYAIQAELDLHGLNQPQAHEALNGFLQECRHLDLRCVRIVHGKGRGSPQGRGVLKAAVNRWLVRCDQVLAFCSAPPADGGTGAVYVALRRSRS
jgi:DNA-nicking Smr family endonuclease